MSITEDDFPNIDTTGTPSAFDQAPDDLTDELNTTAAPEAPLVITERPESGVVPDIVPEG